MTSLRQGDPAAAREAEVEELARALANWLTAVYAPDEPEPHPEDGYRALYKLADDLDRLERRTVRLEAALRATPRCRMPRPPLRPRRPRCRARRTARATRAGPSDDEPGPGDDGPPPYDAAEQGEEPR